MLMTFVLSQLWIPSALNLEWRGKHTLVKCRGPPQMPCLSLSSPWTLSGREGPPFKRALLYNGGYSIPHSRAKNTILVPYHFPHCLWNIWSENGFFQHQRPCGKWPVRRISWQARWGISLHLRIWLAWAAHSGLSLTSGKCLELNL